MLLSLKTWQDVLLRRNSVNDKQVHAPPLTEGLFEERIYTKRFLHHDLHFSRVTTHANNRTQSLVIV